MAIKGERAVGATGLAIALVLGATIVARSTNAAAEETYADYSMMFSGTHGSGGQLWNGGSAASQWAWHHTSDAQSDIDWGSPANWPQGATGPGDLEHFSVHGPWVELSGWSDTTDGQTSDGHDYTQTVTAESIGTGDCSSMTPIILDNGRELYTLSDVPGYTYCIDASGVITNNYNNTIVHFAHWQRWSRIASCSNTYYSGDTCLQQDEKWWDDNNHPYELRIDRTNLLAEGKGWYESTDRIMNGAANTTSLSEQYYWPW